MNTIEICSAAHAQVLVVDDEPAIVDCLDDHDGAPLICIENGSSHSYVVTGTVGELLDFAAKIAIAAMSVEAIYREGPHCLACNRLETICSRTPCSEVLEERYGGDPDQITAEPLSLAG